MRINSANPHPTRLAMRGHEPLRLVAHHPNYRLAPSGLAVEPGSVQREQRRLRLPFTSPLVHKSPAAAHARPRRTGRISQAIEELQARAGGTRNASAYEQHTARITGHPLAAKSAPKVRPPKRKKPGRGKLGNYTTETQ